ncbi:MAG: CPCC family cysteine-rich protein [Christensenellales bacterium]
MDVKNCFCCGNKSLPADSFFEICDVCGWQDDGGLRN